MFPSSFDWLTALSILQPGKDIVNKNISKPSKGWKRQIPQQRWFFYFKHLKCVRVLICTRNHIQTLYIHTVVWIWFIQEAILSGLFTRKQVDCLLFNSFILCRKDVYGKRHTHTHIYKSSTQQSTFIGISMYWSENTLKVSQFIPVPKDAHHN